MAKALKKIKKVNSPGKVGIPILHREKVKSLSSKVRKVLSKVVFKKKPVTKAKTTRLAVVRKALTAQEAKYFTPPLPPEKYSLKKEGAGFTHPENRIAKTVQAVEPVRADFEKKELPQGYDKLLCRISRTL